METMHNREFMFVDFACAPGGGEAISEGAISSIDFTF
jgi:hypothetical protein